MNLTEWTKPLNDYYNNKGIEIRISIIYTVSLLCVKCKKGFTKCTVKRQEDRASFFDLHCVGCNVKSVMTLESYHEIHSAFSHYLQVLQLFEFKQMNKRLLQLEQSTYIQNHNKAIAEILPTCKDDEIQL
jgi:hypothetical protein